ncbi:hypothetical protein Rhe02_48550 [Rhizocola hellebori]|uniref:Uncharacterized protein n=1 Tax=Rhizocola hellebori TaxID=1392758 RepID=A0A8J3QBU0_9ACTN|nr:hypothetical protein [Rhizocola hellebori]GIH06788.1 hypothetical protein Rhe02_48550 [Rhizocola hellebori]
MSRQNIRAAWILSAAMAGSSLGLLLIEMFVKNPGHEVRHWGLVVAFAGLSILGAGMAFRLMTKSHGGWMQGSSIAPFGGRPDYQLMGFGAATAVLGAAMHILQS